MASARKGPPNSIWTPGKASDDAPQPAAGDSSRSRGGSQSERHHGNLARVGIAHRANSLFERGGVGQRAGPGRAPPITEPSGVETELPEPLAPGGLAYQGPGRAPGDEPSRVVANGTGDVGRVQVTIRRDPCPVQKVRESGDARGANEGIYTHRGFLQKTSFGRK
jgi:hypothetical protein